MLTKQTIVDLKENNLSELYKFLNSVSESREILLALENLGYLPTSFDGDVFLRFLDHSNSDIRFWAVKNLGKIKDTKYLQRLFGVAQSDCDSMVRREAVSSIGRLRDRACIPLLLQLLTDSDPKVVLQAVIMSHSVV